MGFVKYEKDQSVWQISYNKYFNLMSSVSLILAYLVFYHEKFIYKFIETKLTENESTNNK